ncbi:MAG TPA: hypothetical protein VFO85_06460 [Vicinamibacteria bacterium]|nr:hypothetical protein [Vicinamibacteria bacterium]
MSAVLLAALLVSAALLALGLVLALRSYEPPHERVTEGTRVRLVLRSPYGSYGSGPHWKP